MRPRIALNDPTILIGLSILVLLGTLGVAAFRILPQLTQTQLPPSRYPVPPVWERPRFVVVAQQQEHPYWLSIYQGAMAAARELEVDIEYVGPQRADKAELLRLLDMAVAAQVDGIIVQGFADPTLARYVTKAVDRGIPVVTVDSDIPGVPRRLTYVGSANESGGQLLARALVQSTDGPPVVAVLHGGYSPPEADPRLQGFLAELERSGGRVVATVATELSPVVTASRVAGLLAEHPELNGIYATAPMDFLGAVQALDRLGRRGQVQVVGWGGAADSLGGIDLGGTDLDGAARTGVTALVQDPEAMGRTAVTSLVNFLRRDLRPPPHTLTSMRLIPSATEEAP